MAAFAVSGNFPLQFFGITLHASTIAGGLLVVPIGYHLLQGGDSDVQKPIDEHLKQSGDAVLGMAAGSGSGTRYQYEDWWAESWLGKPVSLTRL